MKTPLETISIQGYKSIRELKDFPLAALNILIGANGSGKTNFISAFKLINQIVEENLQLFIGQQGGANSLLYYGQKTSEFLRNLEVKSLLFACTEPQAHVYKKIRYTDDTDYTESHGFFKINPCSSVSSVQSVYKGFEPFWFRLVRVRNLEVKSLHKKQENLSPLRTQSTRRFFLRVFSVISVPSVVHAFLVSACPS